MHEHEHQTGRLSECPSLFFACILLDWLPVVVGKVVEPSGWGVLAPTWRQCLCWHDRLQGCRLCHGVPHQACCQLAGRLLKWWVDSFLRQAFLGRPDHVDGSCCIRQHPRRACYSRSGCWIHSTDDRRAGATPIDTDESAITSVAGKVMGLLARSHCLCCPESCFLCT